MQLWDITLIQAPINRGSGEGLEGEVSYMTVQAIVTPVFGCSSVSVPQAGDSASDLNHFVAEWSRSRTALRAGTQFAGHSQLELGPVCGTMRGACSVGENVTSCHKSHGL